MKVSFQPYWFSKLVSSVTHLIYTPNALLIQAVSPSWLALADRKTWADWEPGFSPPRCPITDTLLFPGRPTLQLSQPTGLVLPHCCLGYREICCDLRIAPSLPDELKHLTA